MLLKMEDCSLGLKQKAEGSEEWRASSWLFHKDLLQHLSETLCRVQYCSWLLFSQPSHSSLHSSLCAVYGPICHFTQLKKGSCQDWNTGQSVRASRDSLSNQTINTDTHTHKRLTALLITHPHPPTLSWTTDSVEEHVTEEKEGWKRKQRHKSVLRSLWIGLPRGNPTVPGQTDYRQTGGQCSVMIIVGNRNQSTLCHPCMHSTSALYINNTC